MKQNPYPIESVEIYYNGKTETFDLSHLSYPRDLENGELKDLRRAVTEACRKD